MVGSWQLCVGTSSVPHCTASSSSCTAPTTTSDARSGGDTVLNGRRRSSGECDDGAAAVTTANGLCVELRGLALLLLGTDSSAVNRECVDGFDSGSSADSSAGGLDDGGDDSVLRRGCGAGSGFWAVGKNTASLELARKFAESSRSDCRRAGDDCIGDADAMTVALAPLTCRANSFGEGGTGGRRIVSRRRGPERLSMSIT